MMDGLLTSQSSRSLTAEDSLGLSSISNQFSFVSSRSKNAMLNMINSLKSGSCGEVRVRLGRIQELVATSCVESLDFLTSKLEQGYLIRNDVHLNWKDILGRSFAKSRPLGPDYAPAPLLVSDSKSEQARVRRNIAADKVRSPLLTPTAPNIIAMEALSLNPCRINEKPKSTVQTTTPSKRERTKSQEIREFKLKSKAAVVDTKSPVSPMTVLPRRSQG
jgi:hypothetical protein